MKAISSMATRHVLADLLAASVEAGLPPVQLESVGGVDAATRVADGEAFDLVLLAEGALRRLSAEGHVDAATVTPLVLSQVAIAVPDPGAQPAEAPGGPAFADSAELRQALRTTTRIGYSTGPSGTALVKMIETWGLTAELGDRLVQARPGIPVAKSLAAGAVDLGFQQLSELVGQPGIRILGAMPDDCAIDTIFAGAVATASASPADAAEVLAFLASDAAAAITQRHSFVAV
ncbi:substrate-binding domain-containing protein [Microbacterium sp.]|uniref:substrate-binding domain-containing protein n=1 Tax=Microbacterium sp. TaxID=51671 RepID=UPI003A8D08C8